MCERWGKDYRAFKLMRNNADYKAYMTYLKTLSKILCKCKQDSVVSSFLYLDSVFKNEYKLIHNQSPAMNRLCPFLLNLHN